MLIEDWSIAKVRPYPNNPRVLRNAAEKVAESIKEFGWRQPIVVDADGVIIAGHGRHAAAQLLKLKKVPVHVAKDLSPDQVRALRIADNKTATFSEWDDAKLAEELAEIMSGMGAVTVAGFSQAEFDAIEMKARAEIDRIAGLNRPASAPQQTDQPTADDEADDFYLGGDEATQTAGGNPAASTEGTESSPPPDLVPFNALLTVENRQVIYDAITKAKRQHALETTADALLVIARRFLDA